MNSGLDHIGIFTNTIILLKLMEYHFDDESTIQTIML